MHKLKALLDALEAQIPQHTTMNAAVSAVSVGWQVEHSLLVLNGITNALKHSNPDDYRRSFNFRRFLVLNILGKIPRGKGKAPKATQPQAETTVEGLKALVEKVRAKLPELEKLQPNHNFNHPFFGLLNRDQSIRFMEIHTQHHLDIARDMLK